MIALNLHQYNEFLNIILNFNILFNIYMIIIFDNKEIVNKIKRFEQKACSKRIKFDFGSN